MMTADDVNALKPGDVVYFVCRGVVYCYCIVENGWHTKDNNTSFSVLKSELLEYVKYKPFVVFDNYWEARAHAMKEQKLCQS